MQTPFYIYMRMNFVFMEILNHLMDNVSRFWQGQGHLIPDIFNKIK
jgi:hypothetical protein